MKPMLHAPALILSLVLASAYAVLFHAFFGRGLRDLLLYWPAAIAGFAGGHLVGVTLQALPWSIGQIRIMEATFGAFLLLIVANWLKRGGDQP